MNFGFVRNRRADIESAIVPVVIEERLGEKCRHPANRRLHAKRWQHRFRLLRLLLQFHHLDFIAATTTAVVGMHAAFGAGVFLHGSELHAIYPAHAVMRTYHETRGGYHAGQQ